MFLRPTPRPYESALKEAEADEFPSIKCSSRVLEVLTENALAVRMHPNVPIVTIRIFYCTVPSHRKIN